jgi:type I restriction enzyme S subunit
VPEGWVWCRLKDIARIGTGSTPLTSDSSYYAEGKIPWINSSTTNDPFVNSASNYITEKALKETNCTVYPIGTLIVAMYGEGKTRGQLSELNIEAATNQACAAIQLFLKERAFVDFIKYCIQNNYEKLRSESKGGNQPNLNLTIISNFLVPIPPFSEQGRIVSVIRSAFNLTDTIDENKRIIEQLIKQVKSKTLDLSVRGKLVPHDPKVISASILLERIRNEKKAKKTTADISHYPYEIPKSWKWCKLGEIAKHNTGKTLDKVRNSGILREYITTSNLYWGRFDLTELRKMLIKENESDRCTAIKGDLLICEGGDAGRSAIWRSDQPICFQNHIHRVRPFENISTEYLYYFMQLIYLNGEIKKYLKGVGIQSLSGDALASVILPLPPSLEQQRIVQKIETILYQINLIQNNL